ncbi:MAG: hypothetical protein OXI71_18330 [Gemmatimonadota bacterium]|nr:hypothetical protein [Gemmatimonadota bacterium]
MKNPKTFAARALVGVPVFLALTAFVLQDSGFCHTEEDGTRTCCSTNTEGKILHCVTIPAPPNPDGD